MFLSRERISFFFSRRPPQHFLGEQALGWLPQSRLVKAAQLTTYPALASFSSLVHLLEGSSGPHRWNRGHGLALTRAKPAEPLHRVFGGWAARIHHYPLFSGVPLVSQQRQTGRKKRSQMLHLYIQVRQAAQGEPPVSRFTHAFPNSPSPSPRTRPSSPLRAKHTLLGTHASTSVFRIGLVRSSPPLSPLASCPLKKAPSK